MYKTNEVTILVDVSGLCHRFYHSVKNITVSQVPITIGTRMFDTIQQIGFQFKTNKFVFLFEGGDLKRKELFPEYKIKRTAKKEELSLEEKESMECLQTTMNDLSVDLKYVGFNNCFSEKGYEADDLIATITRNDCLCPYIIVSSDGDLYQLLASNVSMFSPVMKNVDGTYGKLITYENFKHSHNFNPEHWWKVKALAGCNTDEVPGVFGIGEAKAIAFFNKELKEDSKAYKKIMTDESRALYKRNIPLVKLPFDGCSPITLLENSFKKKNFIEMCEKYKIFYALEPEELQKWKYFFTGKFNGVVDEIRNNRKTLERFQKHK